jgi:hypothetical protein
LIRENITCRWIASLFQTLVLEPFSEPVRTHVEMMIQYLGKLLTVHFAEELLEIRHDFDVAHSGWK